MRGRKLSRKNKILVKPLGISEETIVEDPSPDPSPDLDLGRCRMMGLQVHRQATLTSSNTVISLCTVLAPCPTTTTVQPAKQDSTVNLQMPSYLLLPQALLMALKQRGTETGIGRERESGEAALTPKNQMVNDVGDGIGERRTVAKVEAVAEAGAWHKPVLLQEPLALQRPSIRSERNASEQRRKDDVCDYF